MTILSHTILQVSPLWAGVKPKTEFILSAWLYLPNTNRRRDSQKRVFTQWEQAGYLKIQNKDVLDGEQVASDVLSYLTEVGICPESICFDKALSGHHIEKFAGFKKSEIKMTAREMTPSIRELERVGCDGGLNLIGENAVP